MLPSTTETAAWVPVSSAERTAAREQLERVLSSHLFRNSKRYPALLRFVVESALDGRVEHLKERTLGVEVFHRPPDYDTNLDPVVRMTAVEIRKRIAQYYQEPGHESELRICFPPGSYRPEFRMPPEMPVIEPVPAPIAVRKYPSIRVTTLAGGVIAAMLLVGVFWAKPGLSPNSALERFWGPVWNSPTPVLLLMVHATRAPEDRMDGGLFAERKLYVDWMEEIPLS